MISRGLKAFSLVLALTLPIVIGRDLAWNGVYAADTGKAGEVKMIGNMEFVCIPAGSFMMGSNESDREKHVHKVTLDGFWMGKYEVTQRQYEEIMGENPSQFKGKGNPVEYVSWEDAMQYCEKFGKEYNVKARLPYEAEWEYACRAGTTTKYYWGDSSEFSIMNEYAVYKENSDRKGEKHKDYGTHRVGSKKPNAWGLYDMIGNVWEWCMDWYGEKYYKKSPVKNPQGPARGEHRVLRGGSWVNGGDGTRSAARNRIPPTYGNNGIGFRLVVSPR